MTRISHGFEALDDLETGQVTPPDSQLVVGLQHVGEMVNLGGQFWKKYGAPATPVFALQDFFNTASHSVPIQDCSLTTIAEDGLPLSKM